MTVGSTVLVEGKLLSGSALLDYAKQKGLCIKCVQHATHKRIKKRLGILRSVPDWEPITVKDKEAGNYTVYKGYCLQPTCWTLAEAQSMLGEAPKMRSTSVGKSRGIETPLKDRPRIEADDNAAYASVDKFRRSDYNHASNVHDASKRRTSHIYMQRSITPHSSYRDRTPGRRLVDTRMVSSARAISNRSEINGSDDSYHSRSNAYPKGDRVYDRQSSNSSLSVYSETSPRRIPKLSDIYMQESPRDRIGVQINEIRPSMFYRQPTDSSDSDEEDKIDCKEYEQQIEKNGKKQPDLSDVHDDDSQISQSQRGKSRRRASIGHIIQTSPRILGNLLSETRVTASLRDLRNRNTDKSNDLEHTGMSSPEQESSNHKVSSSSDFVITQNLSHRMSKTNNQDSNQISSPKGVSRMRASMSHVSRPAPIVVGNDGNRKTRAANHTVIQKVFTAKENERLKPSNPKTDFNAENIEENCCPSIYEKAMEHHASIGEAGQPIRRNAMRRASIGNVTPTTVLSSTLAKPRVSSAPRDRNGDSIPVTIEETGGFISKSSKRFSGGTSGVQNSDSVENYESGERRPILGLQPSGHVPMSQKTTGLSSILRSEHRATYSPQAQNRDQNVGTVDDTHLSRIRRLSRNRDIAENYDYEDHRPNRGYAQRRASMGHILHDASSTLSSNRHSETRGNFPSCGRNQGRNFNMIKSEAEVFTSKNSSLVSNQNSNLIVYDSGDLPPTHRTTRRRASIAHIHHTSPLLPTNIKSECIMTASPSDTNQDKTLGNDNESETNTLPWSNSINDTSQTRDEVAIYEYDEHRPTRESTRKRASIGHLSNSPSHLISNIPLESRLTPSPRGRDSSRGNEAEVFTSSNSGRRTRLISPSCLCLDGVSSYDNGEHHTTHRAARRRASMGVVTKALPSLLDYSDPLVPSASNRFIRESKNNFPNVKENHHVRRRTSLGPMAQPSPRLIHNALSNLDVNYDNTLMTNKLTKSLGKQVNSSIPYPQSPSHLSCTLPLEKRATIASLIFDSPKSVDCGDSTNDTMNTSLSSAISQCKREFKAHQGEKVSFASTPGRQTHSKVRKRASIGHNVLTNPFLKSNSKIGVTSYSHDLHQNNRERESGETLSISNHSSFTDENVSKASTRHYGKEFGNDIVQNSPLIRARAFDGGITDRSPASFYSRQSDFDSSDSDDDNNSNGKIIVMPNGAFLQLSSSFQTSTDGDTSLGSDVAERNETFNEEDDGTQLITHPADVHNLSVSCSSKNRETSPSGEVLYSRCQSRSQSIGETSPYPDVDKAFPERSSPSVQRLVKRQSVSDAHILQHLCHIFVEKLSKYSVRGITIDSADNLWTSLYTRYGDSTPPISTKSGKIATILNILLETEDPACFERGWALLSYLTISTPIGGGDKTDTFFEKSTLERASDAFDRGSVTDNTVLYVVKTIFNMIEAEKLEGNARIMDWFQESTTTLRYKWISVVSNVLNIGKFNQYLDGAAEIIHLIRYLVNTIVEGNCDKNDSNDTNELMHSLFETSISILSASCSDSSSSEGLHIKDEHCSDTTRLCEACLYLLVYVTCHCIPTTIDGREIECLNVIHSIMGTHSKPNVLYQGTLVTRNIISRFNDAISREAASEPDGRTCTVVAEKVTDIALVTLSFEEERPNTQLSFESINLVRLLYETNDQMRLVAEKSILLQQPIAINSVVRLIDKSNDINVVDTCFFTL
jgi:hypothetical protein